jgi:hypothetical protein
VRARSSYEDRKRQHHGSRFSAHGRERITSRATWEQSP